MKAIHIKYEWKPNTSKRMAQGSSESEGSSPLFRIHRHAISPNSRAIRAPLLSVALRVAMTDHPFTDVQVCWIRNAFEKALTAFAGAVGSDLKLLQDRLSKMEAEPIAELNKDGPIVERDRASEIENLCEATAHPTVLVEASPGSSKTKRRNHRRRIVKRNFALGKDTLLQLRPRSAISVNIASSPRPPAAPEVEARTEAGLSIEQRLRNLEVLITSPALTGSNALSNDFGVSGDAAQAGYATTGVEWSPFQANFGQGQVDEYGWDDPFTCGRQACDTWNALRVEFGVASLRAEAPEFLPAAAHTGMNVVETPTSRDVAVLPSVGTWLAFPPFPADCDDAEVPVAVQAQVSAPSVVPCVKPADVESSTLAPSCVAEHGRVVCIEKRIARAIEAITVFKEQSGEPWSTVGDVNGLLTASRHFAAVATQLQDWDLDELGKALNFRDLISSGRHMRQGQHDKAQELQAALTKATFSNDEEALSNATFFYLEIGCFQG
jgi:hypothetical protein